MYHPHVTPTPMLRPTQRRSSYNYAFAKARNIQHRLNGRRESLAQTWSLVQEIDSSEVVIKA